MLYKENNPSNSDSINFSHVVEVLYKNMIAMNAVYTRRKINMPPPSRDTIIRIVEDLRSVLFPRYYRQSDLNIDTISYQVGSTLARIQKDIQEQIKAGLCFVCDTDSFDCPHCAKKASLITREFISKLSVIQKLLATDVQAAYEGDPAALSPDETILCYPGVFAITNYRIAHELYVLGVPLIPRIITEYAHSITGIDIHPGATIGERFFIDHGTGVVIGETCIIGNRVRIYQGVTLGAKSFTLDSEGKPIKGIKRHPIIEDDVIIYSGATILGRVTIGRGSIIGGNVWLTNNVTPNSYITQAEFREQTFEKGAGI